MNIQNVHSQVIGCEIHRLEHLAQGHLLTGSSYNDNLLSILLQSLFDEAQQVLLIHGTRSVDVSVNFPDIVEVTVRNSFLRSQLTVLVLQNVDLIIRIQKTQSTIAKRFQGSISYHGAHSLHVLDEFRDLWAWIINFFGRLNVAINFVSPMVDFECVIQILGKLKLPRVRIVRWMNWKLCGKQS